MPGFDSWWRHHGPLAQQAEQRAFNPWVQGSKPWGPTKYAPERAQYRSAGRVRDDDTVRDQYDVAKEQLESGVELWMHRREGILLPNLTRPARVHLLREMLAEITNGRRGPVTYIAQCGTEWHESASRGVPRLSTDMGFR